MHKLTAAPLVAEVAAVVVAVAERRPWHAGPISAAPLASRAPPQRSARRFGARAERPRIRSYLLLSNIALII